MKQEAWSTLCVCRLFPDRLSQTFFQVSPYSSTWVKNYNISPVSAFYGMESKPSNITFKVLYQEVLSDRFSSSTLEVHSTPILKTQKASHPLLTLDGQHALSFPWSSLLPSFATLHIPLLVISCSSLAPSLVLLPWKASLSPHPWFRRMSATIASHAAPIPPHYAGVSPSRL